MIMNVGLTRRKSKLGRALAGARWRPIRPSSTTTDELALMVRERNDCCRVTRSEPKARAKKRARITRRPHCHGRMSTCAWLSPCKHNYLLGCVCRARCATKNEAIIFSWTTQPSFLPDASSDSTPLDEDGRFGVHRAWMGLGEASSPVFAGPTFIAATAVAQCHSRGHS